ncbi:MAG: prepilin peptidase [candidate division Zixibacteria bacterium]|nr:prepilin peptidase [candidate division Zixibacteria bacterium]MDH3938522.1 prepilin peptidase [candidate division Zixibacteria bacterium]MDH4033436.1 prepilin peptidase [candidate division Zixibacteria bacterium]
MQFFPFILACVAGLVVGSFLNVVIYRVPRKIGFVAGSSRCPHCSQPLKWFHNIPLLSFLALRGKCANCKESISLRYPLVELLNSLFYLYCYWQFGLSLHSVALGFLASSLLLIFFIDLDFQIIPDSITIPGMIVGLGISFAPGGIGIVNALIGLVVGGGALYAIAVLGDWLFKKESMGGGDIKMAAMLGSFMGWQKILLVFISSAVIGVVVTLGLMLFSARLRRERLVPFGPFLSVAAVLALVAGDRIIEFYISNFLPTP